MSEPEAMSVLELRSVSKVYGRARPRCTRWPR